MYKITIVYKDKNELVSSFLCEDFSLDAAARRFFVFIINSRNRRLVNTDVVDTVNVENYESNKDTPSPE